MLADFSERRCQLLLIRALELAHLLPGYIEEELRDAGNPESLAAVSCLGSIDCSKFEVLIIIRFCITLKDWLDSHARGALRAPEINSQGWCIFNQLLQLLKVLNLNDMFVTARACSASITWIWLRLGGCSISHALSEHVNKIVHLSPRITSRSWWLLERCPLVMD